MKIYNYKSKYMNQKLMDLKRKTDNANVIIGYFNISWQPVEQPNKNVIKA